jgi:hypothetical protein
MRTVKIGSVEVTRLVIGGNPFSGFSHQSPERDREMIHYYTSERIMEALRKAEAAGINTFFGRTDRHVMRLLAEYWDRGGRIQWFGQTASELGDQIRAIRDAAALGAKGVYIHGGETDFWHAQGNRDLFRKALDTMRECGVAAGFAGHSLENHEWIRDNLEPDFQMCSYYDPSPRTASPHHVSDVEEKWDDAHRDRMVELVKSIRRPVVHYKVFAGGNRPIDAGFRFLASSMRPGDIACVGHYLGDNPDMIAENVRTFDRVVDGAAASSPPRR